MVALSAAWLASHSTAGVALDQEPRAWQAPTALAASPSYFGGGADGRLVCALNDKTVVCSEDEGTTWRAPVALAQPGTAFLERPMAVGGPTVAVFAVKVTQHIRDWLGTRPVGDYWLWRSDDSGRTFEAIKISSGAALRGSVTVEGGVVHMTWMDYRSGHWVVYYRRHATGSLGPETLLASGADGPMGAGRPSIAASGQTVYAVWMDGRDRNAPCTIELGTALPECTEIYGSRSLDGGVRWEPHRRLTHDAPYSGRPTVAMEDSTILVTYDHRVAGRANDIAQLRSVDNGETWTQSLVVEDDGESTHSTAVLSRGEAFVAWQGPRGRWSVNAGASWGAVEQIGGGNSVPAIGLTDGFAHVFYSTTSLWHRRRPRVTVPGDPGSVDRR